MNELDNIGLMYANYRSSEIDKRISPNETMRDKWYFSVGESAIAAIVRACVVSNACEIEKVLDLPCGHGRVLRHLVHFFPDAEIHACDVDYDGAAFCAETFGAVPIRSVEDLTQVKFPAQYDLIWIGSLFTHTSRSVMKRWLAHLADQLSDRGIIVATFHGRWCEHVYRVAPYIREESWAAILEGYRTTGYGYADYTATETHAYLDGCYGVSLARPAAIIEEIESIPGLRIYSYQERGWADHQDVVVLGKPAFDMKWPNI